GLGHGRSLRLAQHAHQVQLLSEPPGDISVPPAIAAEQDDSGPRGHCGFPYQLRDGALSNKSATVNLAALPPGTSLVSNRARCTGSLNSRLAARSMVKPKS